MQGDGAVVADRAAIGYPLILNLLKDEYPVAERNRRQGFRAATG